MAADPAARQLLSICDAVKLKQHGQHTRHPDPMQADHVRRPDRGYLLATRIGSPEFADKPDYRGHDGRSQRDNESQSPRSPGAEHGQA